MPAQSSRIRLQREIVGASRTLRAGGGETGISLQHLRYPGMDKIYCISDCMFLPALLAQDHEIGVCVLAVACCADRIENVAANL